MQQINYFSRIPLFIFSSIVDNNTASTILPFIMIISPSSDYLVKQLELMHIFTRFYYTYDWLNLSWQIKVYVLASQHSVFPASRQVLWSCLNPSGGQSRILIPRGLTDSPRIQCHGWGCEESTLQLSYGHEYPLPGKSQSLLFRGRGVVYEIKKR